jgi:hypothetical protein
MRNLLAPAILVGILPGLVLAHRFGLLKRRGVAIGICVLVALTVLLAAPWHGLGLADLKRLNLLVAGMAVAVVAWRVSAPESRAVELAEIGLAALSVLVYVNFFAFHGDRTFVHLHDVAHYYLGAKYAPEVGYDGLYVAMLRAEAEAFDDHFVTVEARDLGTDTVVHIRGLLQSSDPVKARFTPERWRAFTADVVLFRERLGPQYGAVLTDHGYNPTPVWTLVGGVLAGWVPAGSERGLLLLALLDPVLLLVALAAIWRVLGRRTAMVAIIYFCLMYGAGFAWTGGCFLRFPWFVATVVGLCCVHRERWLGAGVLLAVATALRIFPAFFALGIVLAGVRRLIRTRGVARRHIVFALSFLATALALVLATVGLARGSRTWSEYLSRMRTHSETMSPNLIGLTQVLAYSGGADRVTREELAALEERRRRIYRWQLATVVPLALVVALVLSGRLDGVRSALLGIPMLLVSVNLGAYYYVLLVLLLFAHSEVARHLVLMLGVELSSYLLLLFADREATVYVLRTVLLMALVVALFRRPAGTPGHGGAGVNRGESNIES